MKPFSSFPIVVLIALGMVVGGPIATGSEQGTNNIKAEKTVESVWPEPLANVVTIHAEGEILHYQRESFWKDRNFSEILSSKKKFEANETDSFKKNLERNHVHLSNISYEFNKERKSRTLKCDVKGTMYGENSYDFHWLLEDLPFDLYQFEQHEKELSYEGKINGVSTEIRLIFSHSISHCHEHVWPR
jgi:hypothetical protein